MLCKNCTPANAILFPTSHTDTHTSTWPRSNAFCSLLRISSTCGSMQINRLIYPKNPKAFAGLSIAFLFVHIIFHRCSKLLTPQSYHIDRLNKLFLAAKRLPKIIVPRKQLRAVQIFDVRFQANCPLDLRAGIRDGLKMLERTCRN